MARKDIHRTARKITTGNNDRPRDETISQSGEGLPDDSSRPVDIDEVEAARIERAVRKGPQREPDARQKLKKQIEQDIELPLKGSA